MPTLHRYALETRLLLYLFERETVSYRFCFLGNFLMACVEVVYFYTFS